MSTYVYERLPRLHEHLDLISHIRLVQLRPGAEEDNIHVSIHTHPLYQQADGQGDDYTWRALYYAWGSTEYMEPIYVDLSLERGPEQSQDSPVPVIYVTKALCEALRHYRYSYEDRMLWNDAICIDQGTSAAAVNERQYQVRHMAEIYLRADGVELWLGLGDYSSDFVMHLFYDLGSTCVVDDYAMIHTSHGDQTEAMQRYQDYDKSSWECRAIWEFLGRRYFQRMWVRQENLLANELRSIVMCGSVMVRLGIFRNAIRVLAHFGMDNPDRDSGDRGDGDVRLSHASSMTLRYDALVGAGMMQRARFYECKDPRDKVYAHLGIFKAINDKRFANSIVVDYSAENTFERVYLHFFKRYFQQCGTLKLLAKVACGNSHT